MEEMKQLLHLASTANDNDNNNEEGGFDFNNEGNEEAMSTIDAVDANESVIGTILDPNVRIVNQVTDSLAYSNDRRVEIALLKILNDF